MGTQQELSVVNIKVASANVIYKICTAQGLLGFFFQDIIRSFIHLLAHLIGISEKQRQQAVNLEV